MVFEIEDINRVAVTYFTNLLNEYNNNALEVVENIDFIPRTFTKNRND